MLIMVPVLKLHIQPSLNNPVYTEHGVLHFCVPNISSRAARTATIALSNVLAPILQRMGDEGGIIPLLKELIRESETEFMYLMEF